MTAPVAPTVLVVELRKDPAAPFYRRAAYRCAADPSTGSPDGCPCGSWVCSTGIDLAEGAAYRHALEVHGDPSPYVCMEGHC